MQSMFSEVSQRIVQNHKRFPAETRAANVSFWLFIFIPYTNVKVALAYFAKYCLNLADRGIVLNIVFELIKTYDLLESGVSSAKLRTLFSTIFSSLDATSWSFYN